MLCITPSTLLYCHTLTAESGSFGEEGQTLAPMLRPSTCSVDPQLAFLVRVSKTLCHQKSRRVLEDLRSTSVFDLLCQRINALVKDNAAVSSVLKETASTVLEMAVNVKGGGELIAESEATRKEGENKQIYTVWVHEEWIRF
ncbi:hypothetical protein Q1695_000439 [Nippostrongylus brasiliensis]|nr:hypothetical protein Q1695_000439 [Nippostrongylus brasiliensis]